MATIASVGIIAAAAFVMLKVVVVVIVFAGLIVGVAEV